MQVRKFVGLAAILAAALAVGYFIGAGKIPREVGEPQANADEPKTRGAEPLGKGKRAQEFIAAFNKGDAKAVAGFWTPEGDLVDEDGRQIKGRAAIQKLYEKVFAGHKGAKLTVTVISARLVTPDVALEDGITEVAPPDGGPPATSRFSAVLVKKDGEWYFESVRESAAHPPSNAEHFEDIDWLIGDWTSDAVKGESAKATYAWAENQNFIVCSFATTLNDVPVIGGTQWIGWDAVDKQIRSWTFYSAGGIGEAVWSKEDGKWAVKTTAKSADGKKITATNIITKVDDDHATWQMTKLTVDGKSMSDPQPVKMKRVKSERQ
jgi:uncharacterized protein (TIGR02246 family)